MTPRRRAARWFGVAAALAGLSGGVYSQAPRLTLRPLFDTAGNMGFATIRSGYSGQDQPLPQPAVDWLLVDFSNMRQWGNQNASCVGFDLARFDTAASTLRSTKPPAGQVYQMVEQMHRDYRGALQSSSCASDLPNKQQLDAFFVMALSMGFATGRASYFYYDTPTPREIAPQIAGDFSNVRAGLPVLQACVGSTSGFESQMQAVLGRVGSVSGKQTYTEVAGLYQTLNTLVANARCPATSTTSTPSGRNGLGTLTGESGGSCMQQRCAEPCKGAQMLLGVVSGPPACQACMAQNCGR